MFQMTTPQAIFMFLGLSVLGLAGMMYYTRQELGMLGYAVVGGVVLIAL